MSVLALSGVALALVLCLGVAKVGSAVTLRARADTAADAAALAGADALALGRSSGHAADSARVAAADNGARLVSCACAGGTAEVVVEIVAGVGRARGHARAEVDLSREPRLVP